MNQSIRLQAFADRVKIGGDLINEPECVFLLRTVLDEYDETISEDDYGRISKVVDGIGSRAAQPAASMQFKGDCRSLFETMAQELMARNKGDMLMHKTRSWQQILEYPTFGYGG